METIEIKDQNYKNKRTSKKECTTYSRWLMEKELGRKLTTSEIVHHKDENIHNNELSNLEVLSKRDHALIHGLTERRKTCADSDFAWCNKCKRFLHKNEFSSCKSRWNGVQYQCKECAKILKYGF